MSLHHNYTQLSFSPPSGNHAKNNTIQDQIKAKKVDLLYKNLLISMPANLICLSLVLYILSNTTPYIFLWYEIALCVTLLRLSSLYIYLRHKYLTSLFLHIFLVGITLSAILWALVGTYFMPGNDLLKQMIIIVIIGGICAGGVQTLQSNLLANLINILVMCVPLGVWVFLHPSQEYFILGITVSAYIFFTIVSVVHGSNLINQSLKIRFEKDALLYDLSQSNRLLEEVNKKEAESKETLSQIIEHAPIGMVILTLEGGWVQTNKALSEILGYSQVELKNVPFINLITKEDQLRFKQTLHNISVDNIQAEQLEISLVTRRGAQQWVQLSISTLRNKDNTIQNYIIQIEDIHERKKNEKYMNELYENNTKSLNQLKQHETEVSILNKMTEIILICQTSTEAYSQISFTTQNLFPDFSGALAIFNVTKNMLEVVSQWGKQQYCVNLFTISECWALRSGYLYHVTDPQQDIICKHFKSVPDNAYVCLPFQVQAGSIGILCLITNKDPITDHQIKLAITLSEAIKLGIVNIKLRETLSNTNEKSNS